MNRLALGVMAVATITAGAPVSAEAAKALPEFARDVVYGGANVRIDRLDDRIGGPDRFDAILSNARRDSRIIAGGVPGYHARYRQFACIRIGHRLAC